MLFGLQFFFGSITYEPRSLNVFLLGGFQSDRHKLLRPFPGELSTFFNDF